MLTRFECAADTGEGRLSTVIGRFGDNGLDYLERIVLTAPPGFRVRRAGVRVHIHHGAQLELLPAQRRPHLLVRVNGGMWTRHPLDIDRNMERWVDLDIAPHRLKSGANTLDISSNVISRGNMTDTSLDLLGHGRRFGVTRSWYAHEPDGPWMPVRDRNWGVRLWLDATPEAEPAGDAANWRIVAPVALTVSTPHQLSAECTPFGDSRNGSLRVDWSVSGPAVVDPDGMIEAFGSGRVIVTARLGAQKQERAISALRRGPAGVIAADSPARLRAPLPPGATDLRGTWMYRPGDFTESSAHWERIHVPGTRESQGFGHPCTEPGVYMRTVPALRLHPSERLWIGLDGVAESGRLRVNNADVPGCPDLWTSACLDITEHLPRGGDLMLEIETSSARDTRFIGFPAAIGYRFTGIWQSVWLRTTGPGAIQDVHIRLDQGMALVSVGASAAVGVSLDADVMLFDPQGRRVGRQTVRLRDGEGVARFAVNESMFWSPGRPHLCLLRVDLRADGRISDTLERRCGLRTVRFQDGRLTLNGRPLRVRGVLHWAWYPELLSVDPSEQLMRRELTQIRERGFNLVKVCMFRFPERFYALCDEMGLLVWQEYPVWLTFPQENSAYDRQEWLQRYRSWVTWDRRFASVVLRSLTCEAHNPDAALAAQLVEQTRGMTGDPVSDNSAYLNQRFSDWLDCHYYRELPDFEAAIADLTAMLQSRTPPTGYLTGEDMDADTWPVPGPLARHPGWWRHTPRVTAAARAITNLDAQFGGRYAARALNASRTRALELRQRYYEIYRQRPELSGFVMTAVRDIQQTAPGLLDDINRPKWPASVWRRFNSETIFILQTRRPSRTSWAGETEALQFRLAASGESGWSGQVQWTVTGAGRRLASGRFACRAEGGAVAAVDPVYVLMPEVTRPTQMVVRCGAVGPSALYNEWSLWVYPRRQRTVSVADTWDDARWIAVRGEPVLWIAAATDETLARVPSPFWREMVVLWSPEWAPVAGRLWGGEEAWGLPIGNPFVDEPGVEAWRPILFGYNARLSTRRVDWIRWIRVGRGVVYASAIDLRVEHPLAGWLCDRMAVPNRR